jgi:hypothetical protein
MFVVFTNISNTCGKYVHYKPINLMLYPVSWYHREEMDYPGMHLTYHFFIKDLPYKIPF